MDLEENNENSSSNSQEIIKDVKARLLEEGREARNLVAFSVPVHQYKSPFLNCGNANNTVLPINDNRKLSFNTQKQEKRHRSASAGRTPQANLRARHWGFLFRNLEQAVDEIYQTCEDDESIIECKESILMLERYAKDFHKLIDWLKLKWEFERTPPPNRPASVSWEIRTSSTKCLASRRKNVLLLEANQLCEKGKLSGEIIDFKNEGGETKKLIKQECDRRSPTAKLSTVNENEIIDRIVTKDDVSPVSNNKQEESTIEGNNFTVDQNAKSKDNSETTQNTDSLEEYMVQKETNSGLYIPNLQSEQQIEEIKPKNTGLHVPNLQSEKQIEEIKPKNTGLYVSNLQGEKQIEEMKPKNSKENNTINISTTNSRTVSNNRKDTKSRKTIRIQTARKLTAQEESGKDEEKYSSLTPIRSKSTTNLKTPVQSKVEPVTKKTDQQKYNPILTGPTVNMNKASQVRQAYNQSKAPQKSTKPVIWKNSSVSHGSDAIFGPSRQCPSSKLPMNRNTDVIVSGNSQKKNWINYTHNSESVQMSKGLVRSVTSLTDSQINRKVTTDDSPSNNFHLNNDCSRSSCSLASTASTGESWADKVKGCRKNTEVEQKSSVEDDTEGWEVVCRGRRNDGSVSLNSPSKNTAIDNSKAPAISFKMQKRFKQPTAAVSLPSLLNEGSPSVKKSDQKPKNCHSKTNQGRKECKSEEITSSLNKSEKNICNHLRREESKAEAKVVNITQKEVQKKAKTTLPSVKSEIGRVPKECISVSENTSDSEREEEEMTKNEALFATAIKEEQRLKRQIEETEKNDLEIFVDEELEGSSNYVSTLQEDEILHNEDTDWSLDTTEQTNHTVPTLSWADMGPIDNLRQPGRLLHIHEKLSSPARRLTSSEKLKRHQQKLAKAEELRGKLINEKTEKLKDLFRRIGEVNIDKDRLLFEKRHLFEKKMARAEEKRKSHLQQIVNKAHDEDTKAREIAFINDLEAQNKLHDIMQQQQCHESRLADMAEERSRKLEEKAAKEAAAQERRKTIEAERQARMIALCDRRRRRCERIDRQQAERREELLEQAREKAKEREERLSALQQAQQMKESELVRKIQQKQEETARRHNENIELIRQRALESSITRCSRGCDDAPKLLRYETRKLCTLCNSLIASEVYLLSHLKGRKHQDALKELYKDNVSNEQTAKYNLRHIVDAPDNIAELEVTRDEEREKSLKKKCRKIKSRMVGRGNQFMKDYKYPPTMESKLKTRITKDLKQIYKLLTSQGSGPWPKKDVSALDKNLLDLYRVLDKGDVTEAKAFLSYEGFGKINQVLELITTTDDNLSCVLPSKSLSNAIRVIHIACLKLTDNCDYILQSNYIVNAIDQLSKRMTELADDVINHIASGSVVELASDLVCTGLMEFIGLILDSILKIDSDKRINSATSMEIRIKDVVSYCVSVGVVNKLTWYFNRVQGPVDNDQPSTDFLLASLKILSSLTSCLNRVPISNDPTHLIHTIQVTDAYGIASLLYGLLLQEAAGRTVSPPYFSSSTLSITNAGTTLLCNLAQLDLKLFQSVLGSEGISLELRHICSFLLWYCSQWRSETILHNVIVIVGFFTVNNKENQSIMQSGETPSVLQQLCNLPWIYFTDVRLTSVLFPTLLACCLGNADNLRIVEQNMSFQILQEFLTKREASEKPLVKILHKIHNIH